MQGSTGVAPQPLPAVTPRAHFFIFKMGLRLPGVDDGECETGSERSQRDAQQVLGNGGQSPGRPKGVRTVGAESEGSLAPQHCWARGAQGHPKAGREREARTKVLVSPWSAAPPPHVTGPLLITGAVLSPKRELIIYL